MQVAYHSKNTKQPSLIHAVSLPLATALVIGLFTQTAQAYVSGGHEYELTCNADGYVLTSNYPVSRELGSGASTQISTGIEKLYLGKSCDAFHAIYGQGGWCWANGGFIADFDNAQFGFARQELYCPTDEDLGIQCLC